MRQASSLFGDRVWPDLRKLEWRAAYRGHFDIQELERWLPNLEELGISASLPRVPDHSALPTLQSLRILTIPPERLRFAAFVTQHEVLRRLELHELRGSVPFIGTLEHLSVDQFWVTAGSAQPKVADGGLPSRKELDIRQINLSISEPYTCRDLYGMVEGFLRQASPHESLSLSMHKVKSSLPFIPMNMAMMRATEDLLVECMAKACPHLQLSRGTPYGIKGVRRVDAPER